MRAAPRWSAESFGRLDAGPPPVPSGDEERVLPDEVSMAAPTLRVGDLTTMGEYYADAFVMEAIEERETAAGPTRVLGRGGVPLMRLVATPDLPVPGRGEAGLFHTAFVLDTPADLAATVHRTAQHPLTRFAGSADHLVSEAFYFTDPEGNGVELYTDRDRSTWQYQDGQIVVTIDPLDPQDYLRRHLVEGAVQPVGMAGAVGHVHLQVGDVPTARAFYVDALGFKVTQSSHPGSLFVSAGGYHHHMAVNTWNSAGAGPRAASLGLGEVAIRVPTLTALHALEQRLRERRLTFRGDGQSLTVDDPWGTRVSVAALDRGVDDLLDH